MRPKFDKNEVINMIVDVSNENKVEPAIMLAIAEHESNFDPLAKRFELNIYRRLASGTGWLGEFSGQVLKYSRLRKVSFDTEAADESFSYGLFQIMGFNLRHMNYNYPDLSSFLYDIPEQCLYAIAFVKDLLGKYDDLKDVFSVYNSGKPYGKNGSGKIYANNVMIKYKKWKEKIGKGEI